MDTATSHLKIQDLITKTDEVAKAVHVDVPTILHEQPKDPVLRTVRSCVNECMSPDPKATEIRQSKGLFRFCQKLDRLITEKHGLLLCYHEPSDNLEENLQI